MTDHGADIFERRLAASLRAYAVAGAPVRDAAGAAQAVVAPASIASSGGPGRRSWIALASLAAVLVVAVAGVNLMGALVGSGGARPATAEVDGREYAIAVSRPDLHIPDDVLTPFGHVERFMGGMALVDDTAYEVRGVDPTEILVVRIAPGQQDDAPYGDFAILVRGTFLGLCPYYEPGGSSRPAECR